MHFCLPNLVHFSPKFFSLIPREIISYQERFSKMWRRFAPFFGKREIWRRKNIFLGTKSWGRNVPNRGGDESTRFNKVNTSCRRCSGRLSVEPHRPIGDAAPRECQRPAFASRRRIAGTATAQRRSDATQRLHQEVAEQTPPQRNHNHHRVVHR